MKNTRTTRALNTIKTSTLHYWMGNHKYSKPLQLKTSYGKYD